MAMEKLTTKERSAGGSLHCRLMDSRLWILWDKDARVSNMTDYNTLAQNKGDTDYLSTRGAKGNRWKHWESGKTIRHVTQEKGTRYLKREGS